MNANVRMPLHHSWPIFERARRFVLGQLLDGNGVDLTSSADENYLARLGTGHWQCELPNDSLSWSDAVYDIFGLPRKSAVTRAEAVTFYCEHSRAVMERLRTEAIEHEQAFVLDAEIRPGHGERRWMRLIAAPARDKDRVVRLHGLKQLI